jgi:hypothetical protein
MHAVDRKCLALQKQAAEEQEALKKQESRNGPRLPQKSFPVKETRFFNENCCWASSSLVVAI